VAKGPEIRSIVFDIGRVLINLEPDPLIRLLSSYGAGQLSLPHVVSRIRLTEHESGRLDGRGLLEDLAALVPDPVAHDLLHAKWLDMFELQTSMVDLAHRLASRYRVYLMSNIGDLHWAHLSREFGMHRIGHGALPSYIAGVTKPDPAIYAQAEVRFGLVPSETVFIDDHEANIAAARARGWHGIVHRDFASTRDSLEALAVHTG